MEQEAKATPKILLEIKKLNERQRFKNIEFFKEKIYKDPKFPSKETLEKEDGLWKKSGDKIDKFRKSDPDTQGKDLLELKKWLDTSRTDSSSIRKNFVENDLRFIGRLKRMM